jgi:hypothetical protein
MLEQTRAQVKISFEEMNTFIQNLSSEFEGYTKKAKKERTDLGNEVRALYENVKEVHVLLGTYKQYFENLSMLASCSTEFLHIE